MELPIVDPGHRRGGFAQRLFWQCSTSNFEALIEHLENDDERVREAALDCLDQFIRSKYDRRWNEDRRNRVSESLKRTIMKEYPAPAGRWAYNALVAMNRAEAESLLLSFPLDRFSGTSDRDAFTWDLQFFRDERAKGLARNLKENWRLSRSAEESLELILIRPQPFPADVFSAALQELAYKPITSLGGPLVESSYWQRYLHVLHNDPSGFARTYVQTWLRLLTDEDIRDVAQLIFSAAEDEKAGAILVLMMLAEQQNGRIQEIHEVLRNVLQEARSAYLQSSEIPISACFALLAINKTVATNFLLNDVNHNELSPEQKRRYVMYLGQCGNGQAIYRLKEISQSETEDDNVGATSTLERHGQVAPGKLEDVAKHWRRAKDIKSLEWLYNNFINRLGEGTPLKHIKKVLGEPSQIHENCVYYVSKEGPAMYLELNASKECTAWSLK